MDEKIEIYLKLGKESNPVLKRYTADQITALKNLADSQQALSKALEDAMADLAEMEHNNRSEHG